MENYAYMHINIGGVMLVCLPRVW